MTPNQMTPNHNYPLRISKDLWSDLTVIMKWSDTSGHRVKTLKCHNEVRDDNRKANEKEIYRRLQA